MVARLAPEREKSTLTAAIFYFSGIKRWSLWRVNFYLQKGCFKPIPPNFTQKKARIRFADLRAFPKITEVIMADTRDKSNFSCADDSVCEINIFRPITGRGTDGKPEIFGFTQAELLILGLDIEDAFIMRWFSEINNMPSIQKIEFEGNIYFSGNFSQIINFVPIIKAKSRNGMRKRLMNLVSKGVLDRIVFHDDFVYEKLKSGQFIKGCHFCGYDKSALDEHHYPIRAKDGGTETISICANCHREFHTLADYGLFKLSYEWSIK
jgi:hypothetical protein